MAVENMGGVWWATRALDNIGKRIEINESEFDYILGVMPPHHEGQYRAMGEPYDHKWENGKMREVWYWFGQDWLFLGTYSEVQAAIPR